MTAGNLFCGFAAVLNILDAVIAQRGGGNPAENIHVAIWFILGACIFDLLDGRLARLGGNESAFGREFDSLADIVSFGVAPALLAFHIVLRDFDRYGLLIAFVYLACGALRLARFNCLAANNEAGNGSKDFEGFPIPAAAGLIASITLLMLWLDAGQKTIGPWKYALPPLMLFLSFMMFSRVKYPSFKAVNWRTRRSIPKFIATIVVLIFTAMNYEWMPAMLFVAYLLYGLVRPLISNAWRREIESDEEEEEAATGGGPA
ncbi:MAG: CDP-diacylglycerol--serine O-phosphatidyltransferase [Chthoniobacterales bacterium]|nr:CDP-diacylglycerol--serine O-phosphatidyltransferase [Chthoniobacterales bacterium]